VSNLFIVIAIVSMPLAAAVGILIGNHQATTTEPTPEPPTIVTCFNGDTVAYQGNVEGLWSKGNVTRFEEPETGALFTTTLPCFAVKTTQEFIDAAREQAMQERADAQRNAEDS
jgi:hypothetical protein